MHDRDNSIDADGAGADPRQEQLLSMYSMPGHLIRRAKQKTTQTFAPIVRRFNLTPIQYVVLKAVAICPGVDQAELGEIVGLDMSTTGQVVARLEQRGLLMRRPDGRSQRVEVLPEGTALLEELRPMLSASQEEIMQPLTSKERQQLLRLLSKMLGMTNLYHQPRARKRPLRSSRD